MQHVLQEYDFTDNVYTGPPYLTDGVYLSPGNKFTSLGALSSVSGELNIACTDIGDAKSLTSVMGDLRIVGTRITALPCLTYCSVLFCDRVPVMPAMTIDLIVEYGCPATLENHRGRAIAYYQDLCAEVKESPVEMLPNMRLAKPHLCHLVDAVLLGNDI